MMIIDNKYEIGQIVYLVTDEDQMKRLVTRIDKLPGDSLLYQLTQGTTASDHYEFEISPEVNIEMKMKIRT